ncbi:lipid-A-disaccharide synthase [Roseicyclus mahoneyensis]|uniref:lipid-A-disaccharide synthase n=1 Tax=Roseicyclus mahoneyensis TaxID=164332 RepID=UPI000D6C165B|nr:lipid-A-disaccharide synthase [Roseicyclus mahoneyensis]
MRLFLVAGEPSGDRLGAALMAGLKTLVADEIEFHGIGGPLMQAEGLVPLFPMEELSVIGLTEIIANYRRLARRVTDTADAVLRENPDALITIDIPEFSLRVAAKVKARAPHLPTIHYVAPTVWAWRPGRARKMARSVDHVLALLPFEPPYMQAEGMGCDFVGHPVVTEPQATAAEIAAFRANYGLPEGETAILVLPGSRRSEIERLAPIFGEALRPVLARHPAAHVILPAAPAVAGMVADRIKGWPGRPRVLDPRGVPAADFAALKRAAFAAADVALAASGTVSLELAASQTPMVIAYDMSWLSRKLVLSMLRVDTVTLVNMVAESRTVPEFIGDRCCPGPIGAALTALLDNEAARIDQLDAMALTMMRLGKGGEAPGLRAARSVLSVI